MLNSFSPTVNLNSSMSSSQSKACFWLSLLISCSLISLNLSEVSPAASEAVQTIELLYNQVLQSTIDNSKAVLLNLNYTRNVIDKQYFIELDKLVGKPDYYSTAYFIFAVIHTPIFNNLTRDQLLLQILPAEKVSIRNFFSKVRLELSKYFTNTQQVHSKLMQNVISWKHETEDRLLMSYLEFPKTLQNEVPELRMMDYTKEA